MLRFAPPRVRVTELPVILPSGLLPAKVVGPAEVKLTAPELLSVFTVVGAVLMSLTLMSPKVVLGEKVGVFIFRAVLAVPKLPE